MNAGAALRIARERARLTREQVARRTLIPPHQIAALEENDFHSLGEPAEVERLVAVYALTVELDAAPLMEVIRDELSVDRFIWDVEAEDIETFPEEASPSGPIALTSERPAAADVHEPLTEPTLVPPPLNKVPFDDTPPGFIETLVPGHASQVDFDLIDRARADDTGSHVSVADSFLGAQEQARRSRWPLMAILALTVAFLAGVYLYRTSRPFTPSDAAGVPAVSTPAQAQPQSPAESGTGPGASDAARTAAVRSEPGAPPSQPAATAPRAAPPAEPESTASARTPSAPTEPPPAAPERPATVPVPPAAVAAPETIAVDRAEAPRAGARGTSPDIGGSWTLATEIEASNAGAFVGMQLGFELRLEQNGNRIVGDGRKIVENGRAIAERSQTPISVRGTIDGNRLSLTFTERGTRRGSDGKMVLFVNEDGTMHGRFSSSAAGSSGTVEAKRPAG